MSYHPRHGRRSSVPAVKALIVALGIGVLGAGVVAMLRLTDPAQATRAGSSVPVGAATRSAEQAAPVPAELGVPFAAARGIILLLPSDEVRCVCFHEASLGDAQDLRPVGRLWHNYNRTKFTLSQADRAARPRYLIMASRGRTTGATSAADLVMPRNTRLVSPVSGTVTRAKPYRLYGTYQDWRVEVRPDGYEEERVVMIHLDKVAVRRGDRVEVSRTVLGVPRVLPFTSETDNYLAGRLPHVHVEITLGTDGTPPADR